MSKKFDEEFLKLDLYELLDVNIDADEKKIKKSFRKKALDCHPDKNPDNPDAAEQFNRLKKVLEILLDPGTRKAYDKVLKGRKAAALRAKEQNQKSQKFKTDLERREADARRQPTGPQLSEEERLRREIKRLEEEGEQLIADELESLNRQAGSQLSKNSSKSNSQTDSRGDCRIKVKWKTSEDWDGYTENDIHQLFYKWGEISAIVMKNKGSKGTALVEFKDSSAANLSVQFEKGLEGKPISVSRCSRHEESKKRSEGKQKEKTAENSNISSRDFESIADMNKRREAERKRLIQEMLEKEL